MRNYYHYAQRSVKELTGTVADSRNALYERRIDPTNRMTLETMAAATSVNPDELLAVLEYRARRAAQRAQPAVQRTTTTFYDILAAEAVEDDAELVI